MHMLFQGMAATVAGFIVLFAEDLVLLRLLVHVGQGQKLLRWYINVADGSIRPQHEGKMRDD